MLANSELCQILAGYLADPQMVTNDPWGAFRALREANSLGEYESQVHELAMQLVRQDPERLLRILPALRLSTQHRLEVARAIFDRNPRVPTWRDWSLLGALRLSESDTVSLVIQRIINLHRLGFQIPMADLPAIFRALDRLNLSPETKATIVYYVLSNNAARTPFSRGHLSPEDTQLPMLWDQGLALLGAHLTGRPESERAAFQTQWLTLTASAVPSVAQISTRHFQFPTAEILSYLGSGAVGYSSATGTRPLLRHVFNRGRFTSEELATLLLRFPRGVTELLQEYALLFSRLPEARRIAVLESSNIEPHRLLSLTDSVPLSQRLGLSADIADAIAVEIFRRGRFHVGSGNSADQVMLSALASSGRIDRATASTIAWAIPGTALSGYLDRSAEMFNLLPREDLLRFLRSRLPASFFNASEAKRILNHFGVSPADRVAFAVEAWRRDRPSGETLAQYLENLRGRPAYESPSAQSHLQAALLYHAPEEFFRSRDSTLPQGIPAPRLRELLQAMEGDEGAQRLPRGLTNLLFQHVQRTDTIAQLLRWVATDYGLPPQGLPTSSLEILARATGIRAESFQAPRLLERSHGLQDLHSILLDLRAQVGAPPFRDFQIDPEVFRPIPFDRLLRSLNQLRALFTIRTEIERHGGATHRGPDVVWREILSQTGWPSDHLTVASLNEAHTRGQTALETTLREYLGTAMEGFDPARLGELHDRWGDLMPIYTLMGRFAGEPAWRDQLPGLGRVFRAVLDGTFRDLKFRGVGGNEARASEELATLLTPEQRAAWEKDRSRVQLQRSAGTEPTSNLFANLREITRNNLVPHLGALPAVDGERAASVRTFLLGFRGNPVEGLSQARTLFGGMSHTDADAHIVASVIEGISTSGIAQASLLATRLLQFERNTGGAFRRTLSADALGDLASIAGLGRAATAAGQGDQILVSLSVSDPKVLLMVGSLTSQHSCQNYATGGQIETLLGYVEGANVRATLGTALGENQFRAGTQHFATLRSAIDAGRAVEATIVPSDLSIRFRWQTLDGETVSVTSLPQRTFNRRHIMKLGSTAENRPGLFLERGYLTPSPQDAALARQALHLMNDTASAIGGVTGETITIPPSRNPGGVYSDASNGVNRSGYSIPGNSAQRITP